MSDQRISHLEYLTIGQGYNYSRGEADWTQDNGLRLVQSDHVPWMLASHGLLQLTPALQSSQSINKSVSLSHADRNAST